MVSSARQSQPAQPLGTMSPLSDSGTNTRQSAGQSHHDTARWMSLAAIALGVALVIMDATIANVALPVVIRDLSLTSADAQWINAVYSLVFAAFIISAGRAGDIFGRRTLALSGLSVFILASFAAGAANGPAWLIAARTVQGLGAAAVLPATLSTINAVFRGHDRSIAFAVYGSMIGGMAAVGPLVGGWLATAHSWRWAFWLNIPFGLLAIVGMLRYTPNTAAPDASTQRHEKGVFDVVGVALASLGLAAIVFALIESSTFGWLHHPDDATPSPIIPILLGGLVILGVFLWWERRRARRGEPVLIHLNIFGIRTFSLGAFTAFLVSFGEFGLLFVLPLLLQGALGYSPLATGWLMMALALGTFVASALVPHLVKAWGKRHVIRIGLAVEAVAVGSLAFTVPASAGVMAAALAAYGAGVGLANAQLTDTTMEDVPVDYSGEASGLQTTVRQVGSALGIALLGGLMIGQLAAYTRSALDEDQIPAGPAQQITAIVRDSAGAAIPTLPQIRPDVTAEFPQLVEQASTGLVDASRLTIGTGAAILTLALGASFLLPAGRQARDAA